MITAAASKYVSASTPRRSTTVDHPHAASVPTEMSVSIVAAPWRALTEAARWKGQPAQKTTGVDRARATHSQPSNCSGITIASSASGTLRTAATTRRRRKRAGLVGNRGMHVLESRLVARGLDGGDEVVDRDHARVEGHGGLIGGVVDRRLDAVELVQLPLDPGRARGAGHALEVEANSLARSCLRGRHAASYPASSIATRIAASSIAAARTSTRFVSRSTVTAATPGSAEISSITAAAQ